MSAYDSNGSPLRQSGIEQTGGGPCDKVRNSMGFLGTFMAAEARDFSLATVKNMQVALDLAWSSLSPEKQAQSSKETLAARIFDAAKAGERSPARLLLLAVMSASGPKHTSAVTLDRNSHG